MHVGRVLVLGAGSAGLLCAMTLRKRLPHVQVTVLRSRDIGVIGVGESTTPNLPHHLFEYLGLSRKRFYTAAEPTWKLGIRFLWGPRDAFFYTFEPQADVRLPELSRPNGYYFDKDFTHANVQSSLMHFGKAFTRSIPGGLPEIPPWHAFHLENARFVAALEQFAAEMGVMFVDGTLSRVERGPRGVAALHIDPGREPDRDDTRRLEADFFIDASGFRSELLGRVMEEPFVSYEASLFNDRAVLGRWDRSTEQLMPYTTAETMDAGWCWCVEHERHINRGYVYSSRFISDDQAREEFARKNPLAMVSDRIVRYRTGRYRRSWVDNVMAIGNSSGFVEPLESSALMVICWQCQVFSEFLQYVGPTPAVRNLFNKMVGDTWDELRDFLALHFWANTRLDTPYWAHCRSETDLSHVRPLLDFYQQSGPSGFNRYNMPNSSSQFGIEGYLALLIGCQVPYSNRYEPQQIETHVMNRHRAACRAKAQAGLSVQEALSIIRNPAWRWFGE